MKKLLAMTALTIALASPAMAHDDAKHEGKKHYKAGAMFDKLDLNNDGEVTAQEFQAFHEKKFNEMDTDGSGVITREEAEAAAAKWKENMKERRSEYKKKKDDAAE